MNRKKQVNQKIVPLYCRISLNAYTDKAKGILPEQCFMKLTTKQEQEENQCCLQELMRIL